MIKQNDILGWITIEPQFQEVTSIDDFFFFSTILRKARLARETWIVVMSEWRPPWPD